MTIEKVVKNVVVGIRIDSHSRELLSWALVKVAEPGDCVAAIHVCRSSDQAKKNKLLLDGYLQDYEGLCNVDLTGRILTGSSVRKVLVREAKNWSAVAVVVGTSKHIALGGWSSIARYCAKRLSSTTDVLAIQNGKIVFRKCSSIQQPGLKGDTRPGFSLTGNASFIESRSEFGESEAETEMSSLEVGHGCIDDSRDCSEDSRGEILGVVHEHEKVNPISISLSTGDLQERRPGWPLLRRASASPQVLHPRRISVVQWVMSLPDRSPQQFSTITENQSEEVVSGFVDKRNNHVSSESGELPKDLDLLLKTNSSDCKWFSYEVLKALTSQFSTENLIGKGGSNRVYKGILQDGKPVAVKTLKSSKEARNDFAHEVDIISSLKHKHITPLLGVCIQDNNLISVYNFLSKGSLEENLHGNRKEKSVLPWEVRFNVAVGIAEALNYLHTECSRPVIHRDVKSSNILLSNVFEPQLSDFGLAIWGPKTSSFLTQSDVVGTFGYLAPEYFMYGKVSDKIDVYAFGIVLLELLSGRKPISYETTKGQESLVMWAKPIIDSGDVRSILDPNLDGNFDEAQMQRMVVAATLCITRSARLRPKMSQILKLLRGFMDLEKYVKSQDDQENSENQDDNDDEVYPDSSAESHLGLAMLDVNDDSTSLSSMDPNNSLSPEEYFKGRWSRSSSFD